MPPEIRTKVKSDPESIAYATPPDSVENELKSLQIVIDLTSDDDEMRRPVTPPPGENK